MCTNVARRVMSRGTPKELPAEELAVGGWEMCTNVASSMMGEVGAAPSRGMAG